MSDVSGITPEHFSLIAPGAAGLLDQDTLLMSLMQSRQRSMLQSRHFEAVFDKIVTEYELNEQEIHGEVIPFATVDAATKATDDLGWPTNMEDYDSWRTDDAHKPWDGLYAVAQFLTAFQFEDQDQYLQTWGLDQENSQTPIWMKAVVSELAEEEVVRSHIGIRRFAVLAISAATALNVQDYETTFSRIDEMIVSAPRHILAKDLARATLMLSLVHKSVASEGMRNEIAIHNGAIGV